MKTRQDVAKIIAATANYYGREIKPEVLSMMCDDLMDLDPVLVVEAYSIYRRNPKNKFFPLPAQIREIVSPEDHIGPEVQAREVAARITAAIPKFGYMNGPEARLFIGEEGWSVIERQGGWQFICEHHGLSLNPTAFQAQVRDQLENSFRYGVSAIERKIGALPMSSISDGKFLLAGASQLAPDPGPSSRTSEVTRLLDHLNKKISMDSKEPDGAA